MKSILNRKYDPITGCFQLGSASFFREGGSYSLQLSFMRERSQTDAVNILCGMMLERQTQERYDEVKRCGDTQKGKQFTKIAPRERLDSAMERAGTGFSIALSDSTWGLQNIRNPIKKRLRRTPETRFFPGASGAGRFS